MDRPTSIAQNKLNEYDKLQQILDKVRDLKQSLANFFAEYEHGQPSWPTILDEMNVLSSQITTLRTSIRNMLPLLRTNSIIPMCISPENDPHVEQLTERRLSIFNHDFMPQLLRTKNLPEIEERERLLNTNANTNMNNSFGRPITSPNEIYNRVQELNTVLNSIGDIFRHTKEMTDKSEKQFDLQRFTNPSDTKRLLEAMNSGVGLRVPADTSSSPITTNDQTNLNQQMPTQPQRPQPPTLKIKTTSRPNR
ncbi:unnamed protein product [Rotaria magnacalcarata]|uniref:Mediator of RNA polymerase II transcription subunit 8 n=4 Tax=Rotaria magnacalcarata TaxID=392030 RepID=A0A819MW43_9BILA|nr:unnamed protein product [Rotaria magnacalcarata]CAF1545283.1 unnamed protein product [Rotaria magnacalcarata]CAF2058896.1 unnamed protein product [Rotaria magnacalcarata]CAF2090180.1 unnamed protein product [Rotaria magnacalcarata]CAF2221649.1 unnamed protein product [Rotaria magnacalcarata]